MFPGFLCRAAPSTRPDTAWRPAWISSILFIGSEGTLGVVTEAELQLLPAPTEMMGGVVFFPSEDAALDAVDRWRPVPGLRMLEYLDRGSLEMMEVANRRR